MKSNRRTDRHRPGYVAPKRAGKVGCIGWIDPEQRAALHEIARRRGIGTTDAVTQAVAEFLNRNAPRNG